MYTAICSTDVRGGDHRTYALQTVHADVCGTNGHMLLFEYPLDNTWTYEKAVEPPDVRPLARSLLLFWAYK
jgi:hypothetical protein